MRSPLRSRLMISFSSSAIPVDDDRDWTPDGFFRSESKNALRPASSWQ